ncbi:CPBP family intramembrane glutamic endopeptidase [Pseudolactococcus yaeyamensis]
MMTDLWNKIIYFIFVLVGIWFIDKINDTNEGIGVKNYKNSFISVFIFGVIMVSVFSYLKDEVLWRIIILVITYILVGISEEILYRSYMINSLKDSGFSFWHVNLIQAVIFAFVGHYGLSLTDNLVFRLPFGLIFGLLTRKIKSIVILGEIHAMYDLILWFYF